MHEFYNRIQRVFERAGSNRHQFCRRYKQHRYQTLQAYWNSDKLPSGQVLADLATEYHVSIDALVFGRTEEETPDHPIVTRITQFLRQQDEESLIRIDGALQVFRMLQLTSERASDLASSGPGAVELLSENAQKASTVLSDLAQLIRDSDMDPQKKKSAGQMVSQVVKSIYQREGKDEWAQLEEVT